MSTLKQLFKSAPSSEIHDDIKKIIDTWDDNPTALQILEVIDKAKKKSMASKFALFTLTGFYEAALVNEGKQSSDVEVLAHWRKNK